MSIQVELIELIKKQEALNEKIEYRKANATSVSEEREAILELENGISYLKGLRDALMIIQKQK